MNTYYRQLGIAHDANQAELDAAYQRQIERYNPERVVAVDDEMRRIAEQRTAEFERIYSVLSNPQRRRQYDISIGLAPPDQQQSTTASRRSLSGRERWYMIAGAVVALAVVALIWVATGRNATQSVNMARVDRPAPDIMLPALDGGEVRLADYRGQVVLVNFWGTWCEPCRRELPALQSAYSDLRNQGFVIIGVNLASDEKARGASEADIRTFIQQYGVTYPVALDTQGEVTKAYRVFPLPTSFFVDAQGRIHFMKVGELTRDDVTSAFRELKQEATALRDK